MIEGCDHARSVVHASSSWRVNSPDSVHSKVYNDQVNLKKDGTVVDLNVLIFMLHQIEVLLSSAACVSVGHAY
jgi:hypothetical protein